MGNNIERGKEITELMNTAELMVLLRIKSRSSIGKYIRRHANELKPMKIGREYRFDKRDVEKHLNRLKERTLKEFCPVI